MLPAFALLLVACAPEPPRPADVEGDPSWDGQWRAAHDALIVQDMGEVTLLRSGQRLLLATEAVGAPALSADGSRLALAHTGSATGLSVIDAFTIGADGVDQRVLVDSGSPDRVAIDPAGEQVVYVDGTTGLASVWAVPFEGGQPVQLTNVGLSATPGHAPERFVPPPYEGPLRVEGQMVRWTAPDGAHEVALP